MDEDSWKQSVETLRKNNAVEEKFQKIQENPAQYGSENGLTAEEQTILEKRLEKCRPASLAPTEISKRAFAGKQRKDDGNRNEPAPGL